MNKNESAHLDVLMTLVIKNGCTATSVKKIVKNESGNVVETTAAFEINKGEIPVAHLFLLKSGKWVITTRSGAPAVPASVKAVSGLIEHPKVAAISL